MMRKAQPLIPHAHQSSLRLKQLSLLSTSSAQALVRPLPSDVRTKFAALSFGFILSKSRSSMATHAGDIVGAVCSCSHLSISSTRSPVELRSRSGVQSKIGGVAASALQAGLDPGAKSRRGRLMACRRAP